MVEHNQSSYYNNGYKFNGKELDEATRMYYYGARYYDPRISVFISVDPLAEETMTPYQYVNNNPVNLIDPTGMKPTPKEAASMAAYVYGDVQQSTLEGGWLPSSLKIQGVKYDDTKSGFKSMLFERTKKDGSIEYTYATAGTEDLIKDGSADAKQLVGASQQYRISSANAKLIANQLDDSELSFTGHSLGGGLAALNSKITGKYAATFNAAGLSTLTTSSLNANYCSANIDAFIMQNDPLNKVQNFKGNQLPSVDGNRIIINPKLTKGGHAVGNMLEELGGKSVPRDRPNNSIIGNFSNYLRNQVQGW